MAEIPIRTTYTNAHGDPIGSLYAAPANPSNVHVHEWETHDGDDENNPLQRGPTDDALPNRPHPAKPKATNGQRPD